MWDMGSFDINPVISTWKGADGDGEGLVPGERRILHTVEITGYKV